MKEHPAVNRLIGIFCSVSVLILLFIQFSGAYAMAETEEKIMIGEVEDIILMPWKIKMPARIDTGARMSSIDARDICIHGGMVEFSLPKEYGGMLIRLPMKAKQKVKSAQGSMKRAVVEIEICLGTKRFFTTVNLVDRSKMDYPFLLGRNILAHGFVVDVSKSNLLQPTCLAGTPQ